MPSLDTNVLVRYLVADDKSQFELAKLYIESVLTDDALFIPLSVTVELEWVLRAAYKLDKLSVITIFIQLLESREVKFQEESSVEVSLSLYSESNAAFADCLHIASAYTNDSTPLITFDRKAARFPDSVLLA
jgi:predicted nucleic-acid-binding protein